MKTMLRPVALFCLVFVSLFAAVRAAAQVPARNSNAVWLTRANVTTPTLIDKVPELASRLQDLGVRYLFINSATFTPQGGSGAKAAYLVPFLDALGGWERANDYRFVVLIWLAGTVDPAEARSLDLASPEVRAAIATEAGRYLDPRAPGGFLAGTRRPSDGILLDLQPLGANAGLFKNYLTLLQDLRKVTAVGGQKLGIAAHKLGTETAWQLAPENYNQLAQQVDYFVGLNYNSGRQSSQEYQLWMEQQTRDTLRAVSGVAWKNKADYPAPKNGVKVFIGFPAYPFAARNHLEGVEQIAYAAAGTKAGLASLDALSRSYFEGAAVYGHSDGEARDGYARWATDWEAFRTGWLAP